MPVPRHGASAEWSCAGTADPSKWQRLSHTGAALPAPPARTKRSCLRGGGAMLGARRQSSTSVTTVGTPCREWQKGKHNSGRERLRAFTAPGIRTALPFLPLHPSGHASCNRPLAPRGVRGTRTRMGLLNAVLGGWGREHRSPRPARGGICPGQLPSLPSDERLIPNSVTLREYLNFIQP